MLAFCCNIEIEKYMGQKKFNRYKHSKRKARSIKPNSAVSQFCLPKNETCHTVTLIYSSPLQKEKGQYLSLHLVVI